jgi:hypothetical protein
MRRPRPAPSKSSSNVTERLHFGHPDWRDRSAFDLIGEYLDHLERIVLEAEERFLAAPPTND